MCFVVVKTNACSGDRIEVSYNGCPDLRDAYKYCSVPFSGRTTGKNIVIGE